MQTAKCPACNSDVVVEEEAYEGDLATCSNCGIELEIVSLNPLQLSEIESFEDSGDEEEDGDDSMDE